MMGFILDHELCSKEIVGLVAATLGTISFIYNEFILWLIYGVMIKSLPIILAALFTLIFVLMILVMKYMWK